MVGVKTSGNQITCAVGGRGDPCTQWPMPKICAAHIFERVNLSDRPRAKYRPRYFALEWTEWIRCGRGQPVRPARSGLNPHYGIRDASAAPSDVDRAHIMVTAAGGEAFWARLLDLRKFAFDSWTVAAATFPPRGRYGAWLPGNRDHVLFPREAPMRVRAGSELIFFLVRDSLIRSTTFQLCARYFRRRSAARIFRRISSAG